MNDSIPKKPSRRGLPRALAVAGVLAVLAAAAASRSAWAAEAPQAAAAAAAAGQPATWVEHDYDFDYMGFTTHYSCDGLREKVRHILLALGARPDLNISSGGCVDRTDRRDLLARFDRTPSLRIHMATLQPAGPQGASPATGGAQGAWREISFTGADRLDPSDCELVQELTRQIVPLFTVRNVQTNAVCVPHQSPISLSLRLEAFSLAVAP
jgi:hypothetical protein